MTSQHRSHRLRVAAPTLEPDPVFLGMLADLGASSRSAAPRTARTAGLRMIAATATVVVIAAATWAAGAHTGAEAPPSPAGRPSLEEPLGPPSPGDVGTPQPDVSTSPGSPPSPGLPGSPSLTGRDAHAPRGVAPSAKGAEAKSGRAKHVRGPKNGVRKGGGKGKPRVPASHGSGKYPDLAGSFAKGKAKPKGKGKRKGRGGAAGHRGGPARHGSSPAGHRLGH